MISPYYRKQVPNGSFTSSNVQSSFSRDISVTCFHVIGRCAVYVPVRQPSPPPFLLAIFVEEAKLFFCWPQTASYGTCPCCHWHPPLPWAVPVQWWVLLLWGFVVLESLTLPCTSIGGQNAMHLFLLLGKLMTVTWINPLEAELPYSGLSALQHFGSSREWLTQGVWGDQLRSACPTSCQLCLQPFCWQRPQGALTVRCVSLCIASVSIPWEACYTRC